MKALSVQLLSAERFSGDAVARQVRVFAASPAAAILDHLPESVVVFNTARQIIYGNERFRELLPEEESDRDDVLGRRLGEALACLGADLAAGGCGMSELCRHCGAAQSMASLAAGRESAEGECRIHQCDQQHIGSLDFHMHVWAMPQAGEMFHAAVLTDVRAEKRLALMERIFYHDTLNLVSGMRGVCELLRQGQTGDRISEIELLAFAVDRIMEMIASQRDFSQAERGEYEVTTIKLRTKALLEDVVALMRQEPSGRGKMLAVDSRCADTMVQTDRKLVTRILVNMVKNALEATPRGGSVLAGCDATASSVRFWVRNPGVIPPEAKEQIFRRTFSTKGRGRGLGTYGMKLFAENYLEGRVGFSSDEAAGTEFFVRLPFALGCREMPGTNNRQ